MSSANIRTANIAAAAITAALEIAASTIRKEKESDNCNERTRFLYWLMADDVDIIDDLGICGHGSEIGKTYLTKLSANEYGVCMVNARGRTPMYKNGKWTYKEEN